LDLIREAIVKIMMAATVFLSFLACGVNDVTVVGTETVQTVGPAQSAVVFRNSVSPERGLILGGQPSESELIGLSEAGYKTVINLRGLRESSGYDEASVAISIGMTYHSIPIEGASGLTPENAALMRGVLSDRSAWPVIVHCASGNRVGALFAIDAASNGEDVEAAIAKGREYGMTSLSSAVRRLLEE
jgi:uncharacterized protein (TIGR01244 family)